MLVHSNIALRHIGHLEDLNDYVFESMPVTVGEIFNSMTATRWMIKYSRIPSKCRMIQIIQDILRK